MKARVTTKAPLFSVRVSRLLQRVEHRCADARVEKEMVYRLRHEAYVLRGLIAPSADGRLYDKALDDAPNAWITTIWIDGELASTFRVHVASYENDALPSLGAFSDVIAPHLRLGRVIVDPTRLAARLQVARRFPELPFIALRAAWLATVHFEADFVIATVVEEHQALYRRVFGYVQWCEPRDYPDFNRKVACMGLDFCAARERVETGYSFFRSTRGERNDLFSRWTLPRRNNLPIPPGRRDSASLSGALDSATSKVATAQCLPKRVTLDFTL
jgi:hypothetical protein